MSEPGEFPIRGEKLRNWLNTAGQEILLQFDSARSAYDYIHTLNMHIQESTFDSIYNHVWLRHDQEDLLATVHANTLIPMAYTLMDEFPGQSTDFLYRFRVTGTDPATGEPLEQSLAIGSSRQLTPSDAASYLGDMLVGEAASIAVDNPCYELTGAYGRTGLW